MKDPVIAAGQTTDGDSKEFMFLFGFRGALIVSDYVTVGFPLHRRLLLRAGLHRELDQGKEQNQSHDQPAPPDNASHSQQIAEDGNIAMEVEPVDSRSYWLLSHNHGLHRSTLRSSCLHSKQTCQMNPSCLAQCLEMNRHIEFAISKMQSSESME